jgi:hypothetical protein
LLLEILAVLGKQGNNKNSGKVKIGVSVQLTDKKYRRNKAMTWTVSLYYLLEPQTSV